MFIYHVCSFSLGGDPMSKGRVRKMSGTPHSHLHCWRRGWHDTGEVLVAILVLNSCPKRGQRAMATVDGEVEGGGGWGEGRASWIHKTTLPLTLPFSCAKSEPLSKFSLKINCLASVKNFEEANVALFSVLFLTAKFMLYNHFLSLHMVCFEECCKAPSFQW